jgi:plastocyanin
VRRLLILLPVGLLAAACGGYGGGSSSSGSNGNAVVQTIQVSEKEYSLNPGTITVPKPGNYAFEVANDGKITHAFTVEASGGGGEVESGDIRPGSKKTIKFTFQAGKRYEMYCPIDGHKAMGMAGTISVGGAAGGGTTTNPEGETTTSGMPGY